MNKTTRNVSVIKRKHLADVTNTYHTCHEINSDFLPVCESSKSDLTTTIVHVPLQHTDRQYQNVHPLFGWYKHDLKQV